MRILVLGAYGLIGCDIVRKLLHADMEVTGLARHHTRGSALFPQIEWIIADIAQLADADDWTCHLKNIDAVINASGALQSGGKDNLVAVQCDAIGALIAACEKSGVRKFIQISAPGSKPDAETEFLRTKGQADQILRNSTLSWVILKPGLVISATAYGGTSLLRTLAAFPVIQPIVLAGSLVQTVDVRDVASACLRAVVDPSLACQEFDLVEPSSHTLQTVVLEFRQWLGFSRQIGRASCRERV